MELAGSSFPYASRKYCDQISHDLRPLYTAANEAEAPAIRRLWQNAWSEFVPFLDYDVEIRNIICSTNRSSH